MNIHPSKHVKMNVVRTLTYLFGACFCLSAIGEEKETLRGLIKPESQATISSEIAARITDLPFKAGDAFQQHDTLITFDCSLYQAQLAAAAASRDAHTVQYENAKELLSYKATSPIEVEILKSDMKQAMARHDIENLKVQWCTVKAPYDGRVIDVLVNEHESVTSGAQLLAILNNEQLEIELIVPSSWLGWLRKGIDFSFHVDETMKTYTARVDRIGAMVDPISQTILVVGVFDAPDEDVLPGMSGSASFLDRP